MHPAMKSWLWNQARRHGHWSAGAGCGAGAGGEGQSFHGEGGSFGGYQASADHDGGPFGGAGGSFGVRRPLRFLAFKLELEEEQVAQIAHILSDLKTERAQAAVDERRTSSAFADAMAAEQFDEKRVAETADSRVKIAERLRDAVVKALGRIHAVLDQEQRSRFAYLIRTGALSI